MSVELIILIGSFIAITLFIISGYVLFARPDDVSRRLQSSGDESSHAEASLRFENENSALFKLLGKVGKQFAPKDLEIQSSARKQLMQAGFYKPTATNYFFAFRIIGPILAVPIGLTIMQILMGNPTADTLFLIIILSAIIGFYLPLLIVRHVIDERKSEVRLGLPDALDMLLINVEAGSSLVAALTRTADEIEKLHPILAEQFQLITLELQAGAQRVDALRHFAERVDIEEVRSLVTILIQSETLGTSLARVLRVHADEMRRLRLLNAEERANKLPVKISLPLAGLILPSLMIVMLIPVAIRILRTLLET